LTDRSGDERNDLGPILDIRWNSLRVVTAFADLMCHGLRRLAIPVGKRDTRTDGRK